MNPITNMKNLNKMNDREIEMGIAGTKQSWHWEYKDSAWIFIGGLPYELTGVLISLWILNGFVKVSCPSFPEGDVICVFSQYGEVVHVNLVRDLKTGKSRGFAFVCYQVTTNHIVCYAKCSFWQSVRPLHSPETPFNRVNLVLGFQIKFFEF